MKQKTVKKSDSFENFCHPFKLVLVLSKKPKCFIKSAIIPNERLLKY